MALTTVLMRVPFLVLLEWLLCVDPEQYLELTSYARSAQICGIILCLALSLLGRDELVNFYSYTLFIAVVMLTLYLNAYFTLNLYTAVKHQEQSSFMEYLALSLLLVFSGALAVCIIMLGLYVRLFHSIQPVIFSVTTFLVMLRHINPSSRLDDPPLWLCACFACSFYGILTCTYQCFYNVVYHVNTSFQIVEWMYRMYGPTVIIVFHWRRVKVPSCMITLWFCLFLYHSVIFLLFSNETTSTQELVNLTMALTCNSVLSLASCCFVIYKLAGYILNLVKYYHREENVAPPRDPYSSPEGLREGFGFFFLGLYTGLSGSTISRKLVLLELIFYLIVSALVRSMFEIAEPVLLALASQPTIAYRKHFRVLSFCVFLLVASIYLALNLYSLKEKIPFITPNVITIAQIIAALVLYLLYLYESRQNQLWEALDGYVYFINGSCKVFEFVVISAVLFYRVCDFSLEWTLFQIVMAVLHLYFNIWTPAKEGWLSLRQRHQVNQMLNSLPSATEREIDELKDVCSICLEELKAAKVTPCKHYFHSLCLRKWLNVQNKCPMCHTALLTL